MAKAKSKSAIDFSSALPRNAEESDAAYAKRLKAFVASMEEQSGEGGELFEVEVRRNRRVDHNGVIYLAGNKFSCTAEQRARLLALGSIKGDTDMPPTGIGPAYNRDDEVQNQTLRVGG